MIRPTRRRLLTIMGAAAGLALFPGVGGTSTRAMPRWTWRGNALGAKAEMTLVHLDEARARQMIRLAVDEIERLENVFNLYRSNSELARLNRDGRLEAPSPDLVTLLSTASRYSELTDGAFDVTVQPLWHLYAEHFSKAGADPDGPSEAAIETAKSLVDYRAIELAPAEIRLTRPDMAITLNGIAQGYITDRVADLLRAHGIGQTLIDLGEIRALGHRPNGRPWRVVIDGRADHHAIDLVDRAIATSSPAGTAFDRTGRFHHLFEPATGRPAAAGRQISVIADRATTADALSTTFSIMPEKKLASIKEDLADIHIVQAG